MGDEIRLSRHSDGEWDASMSRIDDLDLDYINGAKIETETTTIKINGGGIVITGEFEITDLQNGE